MSVYIGFESTKNIHVLIWGFEGHWRFPTGVWHLNFEGAKKIYVFYVLTMGFEGCWRFLTGVGNLDIDFDMVTGL